MTILARLSGLFEEEGWSVAGALELGARDLDGCCCYCSPESETELRKRLAALPEGGIFWADSGDYHYLSKLRMERLTEPFALCLWDNHADDQPDAFGSGILSCGGWVQSARKDLVLMRFDMLNGTAIPPDLPVWISIDLDVLSPEFARTNWDQGRMSLQELLRSLDTIRAAHRVLGVDICGGLTADKGGKAEDRLVNLATRAVLQRYWD